MRFPNESKSYRTARNRLLRAEKARRTNLIVIAKSSIGRGKDWYPKLDYGN